MKAFEILKKIVEIMKKNLSITIYDAFSPRIINIPVCDRFLIVEISSGTEEKTLITISSYAPQHEGVEICRDITKKTIEILNSSKIENLSEVSMNNVVFDRAKKAYVQKCKLTFTVPKEKTTIIQFGNEKISAKEDLSLKYSRNVSVYYSQICGVQFKDLGKALRKVKGSAIVAKDQFQRLCEIISLGSALPLSIENQKFKAILTSLERKSKGEIYFSFLEVV